MHENNNNNRQTLELSINVNDYDTGEPIVDGNIRKTLINQQIDNSTFSLLYGIKLGSKYYASSMPKILLRHIQYTKHLIHNNQDKRMNKNKYTIILI